MINFQRFELYMTLYYTVAVKVSRSVIIEMLVTITNMTAVEYWNQTATFG